MKKINNKNSIKIEIPSNTRYIECVRLIIRNLAKVLPFSSRNLSRLELVIDEVLTNIIEHAYKFREDGIININAQVKDNELHINFKDYGVEYNPDTLGNVDLKQHVLNRKSSGLGIYIIKRNTDVFDYKRTKNYNITTLIKRV